MITTKEPKWDKFDIIYIIMLASLIILIPFGFFLTK